MNKKQPFKQHIKKYRSWCLKYGYQSSNEITLLWWCNRQKTITIKHGNTTIIYKDKEYLLNDLIKEFKNETKREN